ncbi:chorismate-binding protein [Tenacibaculum amylolyticum]|uniref:chorismate-binding protein n=1 Tax=Tenacibaculum amylolyticum TaxID=104269 RepID=UPI003894D23C
MKIFQDIISSLSKELPFVVYKTPNTNKLKGFFQHTNEKYYTKSYQESGFVFAPFDSNKDTILIPINKATYVKEEVAFTGVDLNSVDFPLNEKGKEKHITLVKKGVNAIKEGSFEKVVLSRKEIISLEKLEVVEILQKLIVKYPTAFVYVWYHPTIGMWLGATPETLMSIEGESFKTMSLAGTQVFKEGNEVVWEPKEIEEQEIVTRYIKKKLDPICNELQIHDLETIQIGNLLHLRTTITGRFLDSIANLINVLHPTPAVCGFPKEKSKQFIIEKEGYDRSFYTGFLGELNLESDQEVYTNLYVNLRCMEVENSKVSIYVGGGITKDSDEVKEWEETVAKSKAMKSIIT